MDIITNDTTNKNESPGPEVMDPDRLNENGLSNLTKWESEPTIQSLKADLAYADQENKNQRINVDGWSALKDATGSESGMKSKLPGRSSLQPKLIRKSNEWRYPALSEPFLSSDRIFTIKPTTHADVQSARQNQLVLNWQFDTKIDRTDLIDRLVRTLVDEGTCILRVGWDRQYVKVAEQVPKFKYFELDINDPDDQKGLQMLQKATEMQISGSPEYDQLPETLIAAVEYSEEHQIPVRAEEDGFETIVKDKMVTNCPEVSIVDVRNFFIDPSCKGVWKKAQYSILTYETTKSDMLKDNRFKNLDKVNWAANRISSNAGNPDHETETPIDDSRTNTDKAKVLAYEYWGLHDIHGDGRMVPIVVTWIGDTIVQMIENPFPDKKSPFVLIPYMPILKSSFGEADASLLQDNQRTLGAVTRGMIDLMGRSANAQTGYSKSFLDPVNRKRFAKGLDFEFNPNEDPRTQMIQMTYPEIPNSALQVAAQQNFEAEGLSGVKAFSTGITGESYGKVARGISGAMDAAGQREMSIVRRIASGLAQVGSKIVSMNQKFMSAEEVVQISDQEFVKVKREDLGGNFNLKVDISSAKADEERASNLSFMLQTQGPNMDPGLEQVILAEIADLKRMPELAHRIRNYKPEPDPLVIQKQELEIRKLKADIELDEARAAEARARAENINVETQEEAAGIKHERAVEAAGAQARGNRDLEVTKSLLSGQTPEGNIEAAVGFNTLTEANDQRETALPGPVPQEQPLPGSEGLIDADLGQEQLPLAFPG